MPRKLTDIQRLLREAESIMDDIPSIYQGVGRLGRDLHRYKSGTKRGKAVNAAYVKLNNEGAEACARVRLVLYFAKLALE